MGGPPLRIPLDDLPFACFRATPEGLILDANQAWADLLALPSREAARGMALRRVTVMADFGTPLLPGKGRPATRTVRVLVRRHDGVLLPVRLVLRRVDLRAPPATDDLPASTAELPPDLLGVAEIDEPPGTDAWLPGHVTPDGVMPGALRALSAHPAWARTLLMATDGAGIGFAINVYPADGLPSMAYINETGARLLGESPHHLVAGPPFPAPTPDEEEQLRAAAVPRGRGPSAVTLRREVEAQHGPPRSLEVTVSFATYGGQAATFALIRDVTEELRAEAERAEARWRERELEHLRALDRSRVQFLNNAAHQLFTPLTPMRLQLHLLRARPDDLTSAQERSLAMLERSVDRLESMAKELMEAADVQGSLVTPSCQQVDLGALADERLAALRARIDRAGIGVEQHVEGPGPVLADADPTMVRRILDHLLRNALLATSKSTRPGGTIDIRVRTSEQAAEVAVRDTGIGFTTQEVEGFFAMFQGHRSSQSEPSGWGLGLPLCRSLAELQGGRLTAASPGPDQGATFTLTLPLVGGRTLRGPDLAPGAPSASAAPPG